MARLAAAPGLDARGGADDALTLSPPGERPLAGADDIAQLHALVADLAKSQARMGAALERLEGEASDDALALDDAIELASGDSLAEPIAEYDTPVAASFDAEGVDTTWSDAGAQALREAFGAHADVNHVECRDTLCRVELAPAAQAAGAAMLTTLAMSMPWPAESYVHYGDAALDEPTVVYVARDGYSLAGELTAM